MIERAARDPETDIGKMNALYDLMQRRNTDQAKIAFDDALARAQATFPIIQERGRLKIYSKEVREMAAKEGEHVYRGHRPIQNTPYPLWEDVVEGIMPSLTREGLSLSFNIKTEKVGESFKIIVVGFLRRAGVTVEAETPPLQHDATGSKNSIQAIKSTTSYGKAMVAGMLTNFASRGENDDGQGGASLDQPEPLSADDIAYVEQLLRDTNSDVPKFLETIGAASIAEMNVEQFKRAVSLLNEKKRRETKKAAQP